MKQKQLTLSGADMSKNGANRPLLFAGGAVPTVSALAASGILGRWRIFGLMSTAAEMVSTAALYFYGSICLDPPGKADDPFVPLGCPDGDRSLRAKRCRADLVSLCRFAQRAAPFCL